MTDGDTDPNARTDEPRSVEQHGETEPGDGETGGTEVSATRPDAGATADEATAAESPAAESSGTDRTDGGRSAGERLAWVVQVGALVILCLLALVAVFRFYFAASQAISVWISRDFISVFQAAFNLLILVACAYGVSVLVRRLS